MTRLLPGLASALALAALCGVLSIAVRSSAPGEQNLSLDRSDAELFEAFIVTYNKHYASAEERAARVSIFQVRANSTDSIVY